MLLWLLRRFSGKIISRHSGLSTMMSQGIRIVSVKAPLRFVVKVKERSGGRSSSASVLCLGSSKLSVEMIRGLTSIKTCRLGMTY